MAAEKTAIVLGGGGARGALQVGALRALIEAGVRPGIMVGTSVGALNAGALAIYGIDMAGYERLVWAWHEAAEASLLPPQSWWTLMGTLFRHTQHARQDRLREFLVTHGISPDLRFGDIQGVRLGMVAADVNSHEMVVFGARPDDLVLDGILASSALVPWLPPVESDGRLLIDGGAVSNVPIQVAMDWGAREIIALDLADDRPLGSSGEGTTAFMLRLLHLVSSRQTALELALAEARGVRVHYIHLVGSEVVPIWDFSHTDELIEEGYAIAREALARESSGRVTEVVEWVGRLLKRW